MKSLKVAFVDTEGKCETLHDWCITTIDIGQSCALGDLVFSCIHIPFINMMNFTKYAMTISDAFRYADCIVAHNVAVDKMNADYAFLTTDNATLLPPASKWIDSIDVVKAIRAVIQKKLDDGEQNVAFERLCSVYERNDLQSVYDIVVGDGKLKKNNHRANEDTQALAKILLSFRNEYQDATFAFFTSNMDASTKRVVQCLSCVDDTTKVLEFNDAKGKMEHGRINGPKVIRCMVPKTFDKRAYVRLYQEDETRRETHVVKNIVVSENTYIVKRRIQSETTIDILRKSFPECVGVYDPSDDCIELFRRVDIGRDDE